MDKLMRVLVRQEDGRVIMDDKHQGYTNSADYEIREEVLENKVIIIRYYLHELDDPGLQPM